MSALLHDIARVEFLEEVTSLPEQNAVCPNCKGVIRFIGRKITIIRQKARCGGCRVRFTLITAPKAHVPVVLVIGLDPRRFPFVASL